MNSLINFTCSSGSRAANLHLFEHLDCTKTYVSIDLIVFFTCLRKLVTLALQQD